MYIDVYEEISIDRTHKSRVRIYFIGDRRRVNRDIHPVRGQSSTRCSIRAFHAFGRIWYQQINRLLSFFEISSVKDNVSMEKGIVSLF